MSKPAAFKANYADWKLVKTRACVQIIFEIPVEKANEAYEVLGGMPFSATESWFAIARLKQQQEEPTTATEKPAPVSPPVRVPRNKLAMRAGILSSDPLFRKFMSELELGDQYEAGDKEAPAKYIRSYCEVDSRKEILPGTNAEKRFDLLETAYVCWRDKDQFVEQPA